LKERSSIIVLWVTAAPVIEGLAGWQAFGPQVIKYTGAREVYVIGGGATSYDEYQWMSKNLGFMTWHYFPAVRVQTPGGNPLVELSAFDKIVKEEEPPTGKFIVNQTFYLVHGKERVL